MASDEASPKWAAFLDGAKQRGLNVGLTIERRSYLSLSRSPAAVILSHSCRHADTTSSYIFPGVARISRDCALSRPVTARANRRGPGCSGRGAASTPRRPVLCERHFRTLRDQRAPIFTTWLKNARSSAESSDAKRDHERVSPLASHVIDPVNKAIVKAMRTRHRGIVLFRHQPIGCFRRSPAVPGAP